MRTAVLRSMMVWSRCVCWVIGIASTAAAEGTLPVANRIERIVTSINQLQRLSANGPRLCSVRLEGVVVWQDCGRGQMVVQDSTGVELLHVSANLPAALGRKVVLDSTCLIREGQYLLGPVPLVNNDGVHGMVEKSGAVFLNTGRHSIRIDWFNGDGAYGLGVYFAGPDLPRQPIPNAVLFRPVAEASAGVSRWTNGVD